MNRYVHYYFKLILLVIAYLVIGRNAWAASDVWRQTANKCIAPDGFVFPSKKYADHPPYQDAPCDDGDSLLFMALLCYSGDTDACEGVRRSQTPDGKFWRSPFRAQTDNLHFENNAPVHGESGELKSMSFDHHLGVLLWAWKTRSDPRTIDALTRWFSWMDSLGNGRSCWVKLFGCQLYGVPRWCADDKCLIKPHEAYISRAVYEVITGHAAPTGFVEYNSIVNTALGITTIAPPLRVFLEVVSDVGGLGDTPGQAVTRYENIGSSDGFTRHLAAIEALLLQLINVDRTAATQVITKIATKYPESRLNAYYQFLNEGGTARVKELTASVCPTTTMARTSMQYQWIWESDRGDKWTTPYTDPNNRNNSSMIWDCIMMRNLVGDNSLGVDKT